MFLFGEQSTPVLLGRRQEKTRTMLFSFQLPKGGEKKSFHAKLALGSVPGRGVRELNQDRAGKQTPAGELAGKDQPGWLLALAAHRPFSREFDP